MQAWLVVLALAAVAGPQQSSRFFTASRPVEEMTGRQAVVDTSLGTFVIDLLPEAAPNHAGYFMQLAEEGAYDGTAFHRVIRHGIIQGGDPLSRDPASRDRYGTGGLGVLKAEFNEERHTRGAVSAVLVPGKPDSAGSQFFICVTDQPALDGQHTVFGRVVEGLDVVTRISETPADSEGRPLERVEIRSVTVRDRPLPEAEPFSTESVTELAAYKAVLETGAGEIAIEFLPDTAPEHVRNFLRLAGAGVYDGMAFHRVVRGFVIQTGSLDSRREPLAERQQRYVRTLAPEFSDVPHVRGTVSMARGSDPASASTSFFICTAPAPALDGEYTAFGRVVSGLEAVDAIEAAETDGDRPLVRIEVIRVRVERAPV